MATPRLFLAVIIAVVGREGVLAAASARESRCGRRLVSGLFSRPRLPLGYSYVTTVPRGACRLNVSEIVPSENYIALKISNSSYIVNGEFAVSAPGTYDAAGARFFYSRPGGLDTIFALGPIQYPIDIMVLYTQPNPSIRYAYFTESQPGQLDSESVTKTTLLDGLPSGTSKHTRRHHSFESHTKLGPSMPRFPSHANTTRDFIDTDEDIETKYTGGRKFVWKIMSYTQCSRTCGGGIQVGKFRCAEVGNGFDKEVSSVHCSGSPPAARRRRCGNNPCPPRWRAAAWSACPQCGPASKSRIVGCVQDHARGITKISDQKCPSPKPITTEICDVPDCSGTKQSETKRVLRPREHIDAFHDGPVYSVAVNNSDLDIGAEYEFSGASAGWLYTEWSECVGWCVGGGVQTRGVRCVDPTTCVPKGTPASTNACSPKLSCEPHEGQWFTGEWSNCTSRCSGKQVRGVLCIGGSGRHLRDSACKGHRPEHERDCGDNCTPTWYFSDWSLCMGNCSSGIGVQRRMVWCARGGVEYRDAVVEDKECGGSPPSPQRACSLTCKITPATIPPDLAIESQKTLENNFVDTEETITKETNSKDCEDKLGNCDLAVQARLCHYKYYITNCCNSCKGR